MQRTRNPQHRPLPVHHLHSLRWTKPQPLDRLLQQLELDQLDRDLFLGDAGQGRQGHTRLFGGLVAAQSVVAAYRTVVDAGVMHSLHAYFLRPGRYDVPIRYVVYRIRDGRTFTTRDVVAYQSGEAIFNLSCSFARPEEGLSHAEPAPDVPGPDGLPEWTFGGRPTRPEEGEMMARFMRDSPVEVRAIDPIGGAPGDCHVGASGSVCVECYPMSRCSTRA